MKKRGQFYLIAAMVIIMIIIGIATISNYAKKKEDIRLYDLKDELGIESGEVIEYGVYSPENLKKVDKDYTKVSDIVEDFTMKYTKYAGEGKNIVFIYGNENEIKGTSCGTASAGDVEVTFEQTQVKDPQEQEVCEPLEETTKSNGGSQVTVSLPNGKTQTIKLRPGENFFFIITQEVEEETYSETNINPEDIVENA